MTDKCPNCNHEVKLTLASQSDKKPRKLLHYSDGIWTPFCRKKDCHCNNTSG
jgi:hypothetical protein